MNNYEIRRNIDILDEKRLFKKRINIGAIAKEKINIIEDTTLKIVRNLRIARDL